MVEILVIMAMTLLSFVSIICIIVLRNGLQIRIQHNHNKPPATLPPIEGYSATQLAEMQQKADEEYTQATKAIQDMADVLQDFMCGPENKKELNKK